MKDLINMRVLLFVFWDRVIELMILIKVLIEVMLAIILPALRIIYRDTSIIRW